MAYRLKKSAWDSEHYCLRVSKYDPRYRDYSYVGPRRPYLRNEWTSFEDIGSEFDDGVLTLEKYMKAEDAYIEAINQLLAAFGAESFNVCGIEHQYSSPSDLGADEQRWLADVANAATIGNDRLNNALRLLLRNVLWFRLEFGDDGYLQGGREYFVYIGGTCRDLSEALIPDGIFVENGFVVDWSDEDE